MPNMWNLRAAGSKQMLHAVVAALHNRSRRLNSTYLRNALAQGTAIVPKPGSIGEGAIRQRPQIFDPDQGGHASIRRKMRSTFRLEPTR
jgi:hypothetical protein